MTAHQIACFTALGILLLSPPGHAQDGGASAVLAAASGKRDTCELLQLKSTRAIAPEKHAASFAFALRLPERLLRRCRRPLLLPPLLLLLLLPLLLLLLLRGVGVEKGVLGASVSWWCEPPAGINEHE